MAHIGDAPPVDLDIAVAEADRTAEPAMCGIKFQEKGRRFHRRQVIDGDDVEIPARRFQKRPKNVPADPAKSIDGNLLHNMSPPVIPWKYRNRGHPVN